MDGASEIGASPSGTSSFLADATFYPIPPAPEPGPEPKPDNDNNDTAANAAQKRNNNKDDPKILTAAGLTRIMRRVLPANVKISDEAKEVMRDCVTEYVSFITSEANFLCGTERRKIVTPEDVMWALQTLGFHNYVEPLTVYLKGYRQSEGLIPSSGGRVNLNLGPPVGRSMVLAVTAQPLQAVPPLAAGPSFPGVFGGNAMVGGGYGFAGPSTYSVFPPAQLSAPPQFDPFAAFAPFGGRNYN